MNRLKTITACLALTLTFASCAGYDAFKKAEIAEVHKNWDEAVVAYGKALELDPTNIKYRMALMHVKMEASRVHFEKGKTLRTAASSTTGAEQYRLAQLAATELELTVKLDPTNQFAAAELGKVIGMMQDAARTADANSIDAIKKRAKNNITKAQPPQLNPASDQPISLSFPRETPVKEIYRALGNAFGINILFDQAVKDDRISIELRDVTAEQALERLMQAASHFYKVLDEKTIIIVPDNPQARRDYEDLVIRTFYLSNGDAEQVTNVVRTMIEARNVFPLKALNAITIRDTAAKVLIAEKIIEANDKAKAEVVVDVELLQLDTNTARNLGMQLSTSSINQSLLTPDGKSIGSLTLDQLRIISHHGDAHGPDNSFPASPGYYNFTIPSITYNLVKQASSAELLANPELRISEGEKATLHIGNRIPVPVSTFNSITAGTTNGAVAPVTSYQYQDVGIKVSMEPRVHHNREVTLKLTVEVSNVSGYAPDPTTGKNSNQPIIGTRTIESTIRLKDGETNFLAGLIQRNSTENNDRVPFLGDIPILGRIFSNRQTTRGPDTDLMLTMTPHIVRIPDITEDDVAPLWVGTSNNMTFRGMSPRIESQSGVDPFTVRPASTNTSTDYPPGQLSSDGEPGNFIVPAPGRVGNSGGARNAMPPAAPGGTAPNDPFKNPPQPQPVPEPQVRNDIGAPKMGTTAQASVAAIDTANAASAGLAPRIGPQPVNLPIKPGEEKLWNVVGMDLEGLSSSQILMHYDPRALDVSEVMFGPALVIDPKQPPVATINRETGTIRIVSSDGKPLQFGSGGEVAILRVHGGLSGQTFLVLENPDLKARDGRQVMSTIAGGRANVD